MPFSDHLAISIGFFAGILPAVILIFYTLKEYDDYYEDKHFFILLILGLIIGVPTSLFYYWSIIYLATVKNLMANFVIFLIIAIYELLILTIIISMKRFGGKYDLTYYGVVLGGSKAGVIAMFCIFLFFRTNDINPQGALSLGLLIPTLPMLYISIGSMIGFGLFRGLFLKYAILVVIIKTIFNGLFIFWFIAFLYWYPEYGWELMIIGIIFSYIIYDYSRRRILIEALPETLRKHRRRKKRKEFLAH